MIDISKFITIDEDGKPVVDTKAYESAYDSDLRKALDKNSETTRTKLEAEIRKQLEEEAKLSAEEKLSKDRQAFEQEKADFIRQMAQEKAKTKMASAGLGEDEIATYLELVTDDESISKIDKLLDFQQKRNETFKKQYQNEIMTKQGNLEGNSNEQTKSSLGKQMAERYQQKNQAEAKVTAWSSEK